MTNFTYNEATYAFNGTNRYTKKVGEVTRVIKKVEFEEALAAFTAAQDKPEEKPAKKPTIAKEDFKTKLESIITTDGYKIIRITESGATIQHGDKTLAVRYRPYGYRINLKNEPSEETKKKAKNVTENSGNVAKTYPWSVYATADNAMELISELI